MYMIEIIKYEDKYQERWDDFVLNKSINGTFLQSRNFLNYHPEGRFCDASLLVMQGTNIVAVIPACDVIEDNRRTFYSHKGSTYGGIIMAAEKYNISIFEEIFPAIENYVIQCGFKCILFKPTLDIICKSETSLFDYYFYKNGYSQYNELNLYINIQSSHYDLLGKMNSSRRRGYRYSLKNDLEFRHLETDTELALFHKILSKNLLRHKKVPVHSREELIEFKRERLKYVCDFYGVFYQNTMIAGTMLFYFGNSTVHTQYLAQDYDYSNLYAMNFLIFNVEQLALEKGFKFLTLGVSTEDHKGKILNNGLALFKEGFGCNYCINRTFFKNID